MTYRDLKAIHPRSDVIRLLMMENAELSHQLMACRVMYGGLGYTGGVSHSYTDHGPREGRLNAVRTILSLRARYDAMTPEERDALEMTEEAVD